MANPRRRTARVGARGPTPMGDYVRIGQSTTFRTLVESASRRGEVAIGYRIVGGSSNGGVVVNPSKSEEIVLSESDRVVVLAED
jgi:ion channel POLLUX/CASTOR